MDSAHPGAAVSLGGVPAGPAATGTRKESGNEDDRCALRVVVGDELADGSASVRAGWATWTRRRIRSGILSVTPVIIIPP